MALAPTLAGYLEYSATTSAVATFSSGPSAGDLLIAVVLSTNATAAPTFTAPSGWSTLVANTAIGKTAAQAFYKVATDATTVFTFTISTSGTASITWFRVQNPGGATPPDTSATASSQPSASNAWSLGTGMMTPSNPNEMLVIASLAHNNNGVNPTSVTSSQTQIGSPSYTAADKDHQALFYTTQGNARIAMSLSATWAWATNQGGNLIVLGFAIIPGVQSYQPATVVSATTASVGVRAVARSASVTSTTTASVLRAMSRSAATATTNTVLSVLRAASRSATAVSATSTSVLRAMSRSAAVTSNTAVSALRAAARTAAAAVSNTSSSMAYYKSGLKTYTAAAITNTVAGFVRAVQRSIAVKTTTKTSSGFDYQSTSGTTGGSGMAYPLRPSSEYFRIIMYDQYNNMSNVISSAVSFHCKDVVNGGSAEGEFRIPKKFVDTAFLGELLGLAGRPRSCRLQLYLPDSVDPWYDGRIITVDQIQSSSKDDEVISIITEGWQNALGDAIVSESVNPGVQPNGQNNNSINADTYLIHLFQTYADLTLFNSIMFCTSTGYGSLPISLNALQFDGQELNKCIDDVVKQIVDQTGFIVEWWVRGINPSRNGPAGNGKLNIIVQANQNPSLSSGGAIANPNGLDPNGSHIRPYFVYAMKDVDLYDYNVQTTAQGVYNMIALYGGRDPITQQQIYQAFIRSDSISLYGIRQKKLTQSNLLSYNTLVLFATQWLAVNAFPQPQATFKMTTPHDSLKGGKWVQVMAPGFGVVQSGTTTGSGLTVTGGPNLQRITVTVSTGALYAGMEVRINSGQANEETVTLQEGSVGSTMVAIFANNHTAENWKSVGTAGQLAVPSAAQQIQQVRAVSVELQLQEGADKIEQVVSATAPRPFIDHAYYGAIQSASENNSVFNNRGGTASSQLYVYGGGGAQAGYQDGSGIWNVVINQVMISVGKSGTLDPNSNQPPSSGGSGYNQISIPSSPGTTTVKIKDYASGLSPDGYYEIVATTNPQTIFGVGTDGNPQLVCTFIGSNNTRTPYGPQIVRLWGFTLSQSGANLHGIVDLRSVSPQI